MTAERYSLSTMSWVCPGVPSQMDMSGTLFLGGVQEASWPDAQTTSTGLSKCWGAAALSWMSESPSGGSSFWRLSQNSQSCFYNHYPQLVTIGEDWDMDQWINHTSTVTPLWSVCPSHISFLPHLWPKPKIFKLFHSGAATPLQPTVGIPPFPS